MSDNLVILDSNNFEKEVVESEIPVIIDFWAEWCAPCRMIAPIFKELAGEYEGKLKFGKLNVDENQDIAMRYGIQGIPTMMIFKKGMIVDRIVGAMPKPLLKQKIDQILENL